MRTIHNINANWAFAMNQTQVPASMPTDWATISLPHTWNNLDGQDGGNDYVKAACLYVKEIEKPEGDVVFIECQGVAAVGTVYVNGTQVAYHEGGYSTFRANITEHLVEGTNVIAICADNVDRTNVYPQAADFTFYGGVYRDVNIITVQNSHFDLEYFAGSGVTVATSSIENGHAILDLTSYVSNVGEFQTVEFQVYDKEGKVVAQTSFPAAEKHTAKLMVPNAHLWNGVKDPYLYTVKAMLIQHNQVIDEVVVRHGIRTFSVDAQKGFFLNGELLPLRGISRHQDFLAVGNALSKEQHIQDMELIKEVGANTIRLAHYQHDQFFYDLCDEAGMIVWAEIPFISVMNVDPAAHKNCISQMQELIVQNYNHASICFWGIANEITIGGERPGLIDNLKELDALTREMDPTRLTTIAQVSMVPMTSEMNQITQTIGYNHYFGWYSGAVERNEEWLDDFHAKYPDRPLGISEYGAEGILTYHNDEPKVKDYSEEYHAVYHEHMAKIIDERPWLWATHVWNMFDFGCDGRDEGGVKGRNNKGLVTFDRKIKKDAFYLYKAFWSTEEFVHVAGHRYSMRATQTTTIKVYSNLDSVTLVVNGQEVATQQGSRIFTFENVALTEGTNFIVAVSGDYVSSMTIERVAQANETYILIDEDEDGDGVANWFNLEDYTEIKPIEIVEGNFSVQDTMGEILENDQASDVLMQVLSATSGLKMKKAMLSMFKDTTVEQFAKIASSQLGEEKAKTLAPIMNDLLNKIKK